MILQEEKNQIIAPITPPLVQMPVDRLHYSMLIQLLSNPLIFKAKYMLGIYDGKMGISNMVGRAGHEALKVYYGGHPEIPVPADDRTEARALAIDYGMSYLNDYSDEFIKYGKTGSREKMLEGYARAMRYYFAEEPEYNELILVEERLEAEIRTANGDLLPLPAVGIPDLVHKRKDGGIEIVDYKFRYNAFTAHENEDGEPHEDYMMIIQAKFLDRLLFAARGIKADRAIFREIKWGVKNDDGSPKIRDYVVPLAHDPYDVLFDNLFLDAVKFISNPDAIYLPNFSDRLDGENAGLFYAQGLKANMDDVEVMHKIRDVAFVTKKFVPSRLERVENKYLPPEEKIKLRLAEFGIPVQPKEPKVGASVTQYRFGVSAGIRMSVFEKHKADIARAIEAKGEIRILAPIPGMDLIGVEVPNGVRTSVTLGRDQLKPGTMNIPVGVTVHGETISVPLNEMPHLLIAGAAGSGKSILLHSIITALIRQMKVNDMRLILIDPKRVELVAFAKCKHLTGGKIIYEYQDALIVLKGLVDEMEARYKELELTGKRNIEEYNARAKGASRMPYITVVIDEFADLMLTSKRSDRRKKKTDSIKTAAAREHAKQMARQMARMGLEFNQDTKESDDDLNAEDLITRLAQMARAAGIHLIIATQRPSTDVITGLIKANFPARIALTTASATDSKVILGEEGAEKLQGKGDMLFVYPGGHGKVRLQGFLV